MKFLLVSLLLATALHEVKAYCTVPEHKADIIMHPKDLGVFAHAFTTQYVYEGGGKYFLFSGHSTDHSATKERWMIRQVLPGGKMGAVTQDFDCPAVFPSKFAYTIEGRTFVFALMELKAYINYEFDGNGRFTTISESGSLDQYYDLLFSFEIEDRYFFYGHSLKSRRWFIRELLAGGTTVKEETASGLLRSPYDVQFPFSVEDRVFFYGQCKRTHRWFIRELLPGGKMAEHETDSGHWRQYYGVQIPFNMWGRVFFYGQCQRTHIWFVRELLAGGKMGDSDVQTGLWALYYDYQVPFKIEGYQYIFGQNKESKAWFTAELDFFPCVSSSPLAIS